MLKLDIEIPVGNKQNVIDSCLIPSLNQLKAIKHDIRLLLNFNGLCTNEDIEKVIKVLDDLQFSYNYIIKKYDFEDGQADNLIIRRDTHGMVEEHAPYFLFFDDDILITSNKYCIDLRKAIRFMDANPKAGMIQLDALKPKISSEVIPNHPQFLIYTSNGIVFRNIDKWKDIVPKKYTLLKGNHIDELLTFARYEINLYSYRLWTNHASHKELQTLHDGEIIEGKNFWNWADKVTKERTVAQLFAPYKKIGATGKEEWDLNKTFPHLDKYWR